MSVNHQKSALGDPAWEIAYLFPRQGQWSEAEYLGLKTNHLVELSNGFVEVLAMPTEWHQEIVLYLYERLLMFTRPANLGKVLTAPLRIRLAEGKFREPDIVFMLSENRHRREDRFWHGADLVMEVVSPDDPDRDWVEKRREYALAGIPEYWIVDSRDRTITVLKLDAEAHGYIEFSRSGAGGNALSALLSGFGVTANDVFARRL